MYWADADQYARTLIDCATSNAGSSKRALVVGGGIANFTDVAATFKGIIKVGQRFPPSLQPHASSSNFVHDLPVPFQISL